jgi:hypothetical protein
VQRLPDRFPALDSASDLHLDISGPKNGLDFRSVIAASANGIQVNDMEVSKSILSPGDSYSDGIGDADDFLVVRASGELHARASAEVKRRNCDHRARCGIKARIMRGEGAEMIAC